MASSLAVDESSDIRGDSSLNVTEEFWRYVLCTAQPQDRICMKRSGLVAKIREKMQEENVTAELTAHHCIIHLESLCAEALNMEHGMFTITHAGNFIRAKGLIQRQFKAFLSQWQTQSDGDLPITLSTVKAFRTKRTLWEAQMHKGNLSHFPSCQTLKEKLSTSVFPSAQFAD
ncbi:hypothetical protein D4764_04G0016190 [Takifugu flavidus]|uniref:Uncharacterized protein n=1 Tax=Takifugu flavidus TaxID=433684 RepID=A0A5C6N699_9TELE|nr:hypothetical protein D4764_04G0016190 [Takifugu flavidus]